MPKFLLPWAPRSERSRGRSTKGLRGIAASPGCSRAKSPGRPAAGVRHRREGEKVFSRPLGQQILGFFFGLFCFFHTVGIVLARVVRWKALELVPGSSPSPRMPRVERLGEGTRAGGGAQGCWLLHEPPAAGKDTALNSPIPLFFFFPPPFFFFLCVFLSFPSDKSITCLNSA